MAQYIDKSDLVAEIEKIKSETLQKKEQCKRSGLEKIMHQISAYNKVLSFLDTLEVKEVDLELNSFDATVCKIGNASYLKEMDKDAITKVLEPYKDEDKVKVIIKAQKGE